MHSMRKVTLMQMGFHVGIGFEIARQLIWIVADWLKDILGIPLG